jgi:hypothetical protein
MDVSRERDSIAVVDDTIRSPRLRRAEGTCNDKDDEE